MKVAVAIPVYKESLTKDESISLRQCINVLGEHDIFIIKPRGLHLTFAGEIFSNFLNRFIEFDAEYFENIFGYNRLMLSEMFYQAFKNYDYLLIHQLDAFVFSDQLLAWCDKNYDYIGAPWIPEHHSLWNFLKYHAKAFYKMQRYKAHPEIPINASKVMYYKSGNGGLSLRKISSMQSCLKEMSKEVDTYIKGNNGSYHEDIFWSLEVNRFGKRLKIPVFKEALKFGFETNPFAAYELNNRKLPFGCHAWDKNKNFWLPIFDDCRHTFS